MERVAIFCGSSEGDNPDYGDYAYQIGEFLASNQIGIVYGGGHMGLMGALADGALSKGGEVIGVIPAILKDKEMAHDELTSLVEVSTMHERKTRMHDLADGMIGLPGGFGTMEEFFETLTWAQLGLHKKPVGLLNYMSYFDPLLEMVRKMTTEGFLKEKNEKMLLYDNKIEDLIQKMNDYQPPKVSKWITKAET